MQAEELKQILLSLQAELAGRREKIHSDFASRSSDKDASHQLRERGNDEVLTALDEDAQDELLAIKHALLRVETGQFQDCQQCHQPISDERLRAIPYTPLCRRCVTSKAQVNS